MLRHQRGHFVKALRVARDDQGRESSQTAACY